MDEGTDRETNNDEADSRFSQFFKRRLKKTNFVSATHNKKLRDEMVNSSLLFYLMLQNLKEEIQAYIQNSTPFQTCFFLVLYG